MGLVYRAQQGTPLDIAQYDGNTKYLADKVHAPFYRRIRGPDTVGSYKYSNVIGAAAAPGSYSVAAGGVNTLRLWPFAVPETVIATQLYVWTTGTSGAPTLQFGVYASDAEGFPASKIATSSSVGISTTGLTMTSCSVTLQPGEVYWLGVNQSASGGTIAGVPGPFGIVNWVIDNTVSYPAFGIKIPSVAYGAMPNTISFTNWTTNFEAQANMPAFLLG
jgi:hypothetical protein